MHIMIIGASGMIGKKLVTKVLDQGVNGNIPDHLSLVDLNINPVPETSATTISNFSIDLTETQSCRILGEQRPDIVFFLAAMVSGDSEKNFHKAFQINVLSVLNLLESFRINKVLPKFIFSSSLAVYGPPFPKLVPEDYILRPTSSYGVQKAMSESIISDYTRKGFVDGISLRLPTIVVRPGKPNAAASGFMSGIIREPLSGKKAKLPVPDDTMVWIASPGVAVGSMLLAAGLNKNVLGNISVINLRGLTISIADMIETLSSVAGQHTSSLIEPEPDPLVDRIVRSWPFNFETTTAESLNFPQDADFQAIIKQYISEDIG